MAKTKKIKKFAKEVSAHVHKKSKRKKQVRGYI